MPRSFALIPAAGNSSRMGQPKLLLPLAGRPLIAHAIDAWQQSGVDRIIVVVRPDDAPLMEVVRSTGAELVIPDKPPCEMKVSLQAALRHITVHHAPTAADAFLVAPADMPRLSPAVIHLLLEQHRALPDDILVPTIANRRGHPVLFPWLLAAEVHQLVRDEGLNTIVRRHQPRLVVCDQLVANGQEPFADIDTTEEYRQLADEYRSGQITNDP